MFTVAKGLNKTNFSTGGTLSTKAGAGRFKLPIQLLSVTADISTAIIVDHSSTHKFLKLDASTYNIAGNGSTAIENDNTAGIDLQIVGSGKITGGAISGGAFQNGASVSGYSDDTGTLIPEYSSSYGTAANLIHEFGSLKNVTSTTDTTNTRILTGVNERGTWPVTIGGNVVIGMATGGGAGSWWGNEGSDGGNSGAFIKFKKRASIGTKISYIISAAGSRGNYQGGFGGPRNDASHGPHAYGGFITTGNFVTVFTYVSLSATITFQDTHGLSVDDTFTLSNSSEASFNQSYTVTAVNSTTQVVATADSTLSGSYDFDASAGPAIKTSLATDLYLKMRGGGGGRWVVANHSTAVGEILNGDQTASAANIGADEVLEYEGGALGGLSGQAAGSGSPVKRVDAAASEYPHRTGGTGNSWTNGDGGWGSGGGDQNSDNNNSGAPGAIWVWHDVTQTTNFDGDPWDVFSSFGGVATTLSATGVPTAGIDLTSFTGEFTRTG